MTYTYTQRKDVGTYECFVGSIISNNEIYIKEAGKHCERDIDPLRFGMKLLRKGKQLSYHQLSHSDIVNDKNLFVP